MISKKGFSSHCTKPHIYTTRVSHIVWKNNNKKHWQFNEIRTEIYSVLYLKKKKRERIQSTPALYVCLFD